MPKSPKQQRNQKNLNIRPFLKQQRVKRSNQSNDRESKKAVERRQHVFDKHHTNTKSHITPEKSTTHFETMYMPSGPAGIVGRQAGWRYVAPFTVLMCDWTDGAWLHRGSLETEKLQLAEINGHGDIGNPEWDFSYMRKCVTV